RIEEAAAQLDEDRQRLLGEGRRAEADGLALGQARLWARHGRVEEALGPARAAAASEIASDREDGTLLLARLLAELGRYDEALDTLGPADPRRPRLAALRVGVMIDAGREEAASAEVERLLAEAPETDLRLGEMYAERERFDAAIPLLERAVAREPGSLEGAFRLAAAYERGGRIEDSVARFEEVLEAAPDFAPALNYLGYLWIDRGENLERALRLVRRAVRLDPDNGAYVDSLGWGLYRLGRHEEAVETLEWAARLEPDDATVLEHLGDALAAAGRIEGAADAYRRALESSGGESPSEAARKLERLRTER
ncbi:MAG TPA: tetratricopeptide repeat protein, partial [Thermoanaerobaculia bacterium]|nr:tetratricopeptide repeat protein [Thermoanaerobaculia bacterium]